MGRGGGLFARFVGFSNLHIQKGVEVIIGIKLEIRIISSVKYSILFTKGVFNKFCLKRLKLSALDLLSILKEIVFMGI